MPDLADQLAEGLKRAFGVGDRAVPSAAPGAGPSADKEGSQAQRPPLGHLVAHPGHGGDWQGFGGHGDPVRLDTDVDATVRREIQDAIQRSRASRMREPKPTGRLRFNIPFSPEAHIREDWDSAVGPVSLFDGTAGAPSGGNSVQAIAITIASANPSPVILLNRYPGAMYMNLYIKSFSWVPTGTTATGLQELWFSDIGGATCGLGVYLASNQTAGSYVSIRALLNSPISDPGTVQLGTLYVNNIGIGGTPVTARYQLVLGFVAMVPDPRFNEGMAIPPTPADVTEALRSMEA